MEDKIIIGENEIFFKDPKREYEYFKERVTKFDSYPDFLRDSSKQKLADRYIKAIISFEDADEYEVSGLITVYKDCLEELGIDSYILNEEINDYKKTHIVNKENIIVSEHSRKR